MKLFELKKASKDVKISLKDKIIVIKGPLGEVTHKLDYNINSKSKELFISKKEITFFKKLIKRLIRSVIKGWFLEITLNGIGYKCFKENNKVSFDLGYSLLVNYVPSEKVKVKIFKNKIVLFSIDKTLLYQTAFSLVRLSAKDSYKGKGILLKDTILKLKKKK